MVFGFRSVNKFSLGIASWILVAFLLAAGTADGQVVKGTFVGTVQDKSGAIVPGVKITVKNLATNVGNTVSTDSDGNYIVSFLDPGTYSVTAQMTRFGTTVEPSIKLDVAARVRVDFTLEVGEIAQTVSVRATLQGAETDTSSVATTMTTEKLRQLPLLGRNYQALTQLMPTAVTPLTTPIPGFMPNSLTAGNYFTVGGARGSYLSYSIDGVDANNVWIQTQSVIPSLDAIEESKVQSHNFPAEFGRGAVQYTSTTRSGTNALHGSVYDYLQNDKLNANNFFNNKAGRQRTVFRDNQFGFTVGGPIDLGKVYDGRNKSFFFFGYEGRRRREGSTAYGLYPDAAWQTGDFSNLKNQDGSPRLIYDPATTQPDGLGGFIRDPFPGNIIPLDRFDPVAANVIAGKYIPTPNAVGIRPDANTIGAIRTPTNVNAWLLRLDHNFSEKDRLSGRYMQSRENATTTSLAPLSGNSVSNTGYNVMLGETRTFSPRVVNELRLGYNRGGYAPLQEGANGKCLTPCTLRNYTKELGINNLTVNPIQFGLPNFGWAGYSGTGGPASNPLGGLTNTYQFSDNLMMVFGKHTFKTGADIRKIRFRAIGSYPARGAFSFNGQFTQLPGVSLSGNSFADFLLGLSNSASGLFGDTQARMHTMFYMFYVQDDWRVTRKLTLNYGIRYENYRPWRELNGKIPYFKFGFPVGTCFGYNCAPGYFVGSKPDQPWYLPQNNDWAPRLGLAYTPFGDNKTVFRAAIGRFFSPTDGNDQFHGTLSPPNALGMNLIPSNPFTDLTTAKLSNAFPGGVLPPVDSTLSTANWTLGPLTTYPYINDNKDGSIYQWQASIEREVTSNLLLEVGYMGSNAIHGQRRVDNNQPRLDNPGELTPIPSRKPYPALSWLISNEHSSTMNHQAGYLRLERRFENGLSFLGAYTFGKLLDDYGMINDYTVFWPQDTYNKSLEKGLSALDTRHRFTAGYVWEVPFGRGRSFGTNVHPVVDGFLGGWQVSGITTFQTGTPGGLGLLFDPSNVGKFGIRPDKVGPVQYMDIRKTGYWFNANAFAVPKFGTFGNAARGSVNTPGINNWDVLIGKSFRLSEGARIQFRTEMFNAFNHAQFAGFYGSVDPRVQNLTGLATTARSPRNIQVALRLEF